jgi:Delta7-sterol 5-desaturase
MRDFILTVGFFFFGIVFRYFLIVGVLWWLCHRRNAAVWVWRRTQKVTIGPSQYLSEIRWSVVTSFVFAVVGAVLFFAWRAGLTGVYLEWSKYGTIYAVLSFFLLLFVHDTYFYWVHRLMHRPFWFRRIHLIHHRFRSPSPWAAFSFHPWEACIEAAVFPVLIVLVPIHFAVLATWLVFMTVTSVFNHLGYELYPRVLWGWLIGATHHDLHHEEVRGNYGLYFTWWDRKMGTESRAFVAKSQGVQS